MSVVDQLLRRIGIGERPAPDAAGLFAVHRAYLAAIPYEDVAVQLGESGTLDDEVSVARIVAGRGGYCFELNGALALLLEGLGFTVQRRRARVGERDDDGPANHLALLVTIGGERWLADAGLGEGFVEPLPLREGRHEQPPFAWTLERDLDDGWWVAQHEWGSFAGFQILPGAATPADFREHHARLSTDPESSFVRTLVLQIPHADRIVTLRARTLSVDGPAHAERRILGSRDELAAVMRGEFRLAPLDDARLDRLWAAACAQHEAHLARRVG